MKPFIIVLLLLSSLVFSQNTITGTLSAANVQEFMIIGCLIDLATQDCNYEKSQYVQANPDGSYTLANLELGQYIVIAWRDTNGSGDLEEDQDEVAYHTTVDGQPGLVTPPATKIDMKLGQALTEQNPNPLNQTPAHNPLNATTPTASNGAGTNLTPTGNFPAEYVGVWVDNTAAYGFSLTGGGYTGNPQILTMTGAFNAGGRVLKISGDGSYTFYEGDANADCFTTTTSQGVVGIEGTTFTLYPTTKHEAQADMGESNFTNCEPYDQDVTPAPESYPLEFTENDGLYGWKTYGLTLLADNEYWVFQKVKGVLPSLPEAQPMPSNFVTGTDIMYNELVGQWFATGDADNQSVDFYDAATGTLNASDYASTLSFDNDGTYELVVYRPDLLDVPICTKNVLLVERGTTQFVINSRDDYNNKYVQGDVVLTPTSSTLTDELINCDNDNSAQTLSLPLSPKYLTWKLEMSNTLTGQVSPEDTFEFFCPSEYTNERTEWLFMYCPSEVDQSNRYGRR